MALPLDQDLATLVADGSRSDVLDAHRTMAMRDNSAAIRESKPTITVEQMGPSVVDAKLAVLTALVPVYMAPSVSGGDEVADAARLRKAFDAVWAQFKVDVAPTAVQQAPL